MIGIDLMLMLGMNETIHQLTTANRVSLCSYVLGREDAYVLRKAFEFVV